MATPPEAPPARRLDQFSLELDNFSGPLDLLLTLITRRRLDITEIALAEVSDEFLDYMRRYPDLSQTSQFLVVAATLLDIKATRLLPASEVCEDDQAYLEARDLLFARLLQYRAYKEASVHIADLVTTEALHRPRQVPLEPHFATLVPELQLVVTPGQLARLAALAIATSRPEVRVTHLHDPLVPVRGQIRLLKERLARDGRATFADLVADADRRAVVISRFLALLEMYRARLVTFDQDCALGTLTITYTPHGDGVGPADMTLGEGPDDER